MSIYNFVDAVSRTVFLSHARESGPAAKKHDEAVLKLVSFLWRNDVNVRLDLLEQNNIDMLGISRWTTEAMNTSNMWLVLLTPTYKEKSVQGFETYLMIQKELSNRGGFNEKCIPVIMKALGGTDSHIPSTLGSIYYITYDPRADITGEDDIIRRIYKTEKFKLPPLGQPPTNLTMNL